MKTRQINSTSIPFDLGNIFRRTWLIIIGLLICSGGGLLSQDSEGSRKKQKVRLSLQYVQVNDQADLHATAKTKIDRVYEMVPDLEIKFYKDSITPDNLLGVNVTNEKGLATIGLKDESLPEFFRHTTYFAVIEDVPGFRDGDKDLEVKNSRMDMAFVDEDEHMLQIKITSKDSTGNITAVPEVPVIIYVKRLFGNLRLTDDAELTGEDGEVHISFPDDIPGTTEGEITVIARVDEHEDYGVIESSQVIEWGVPITVEDKTTARDLWSSGANVPYSLVFIVTFAVIGVWSVIFYILYQIIRLNKLGSANSVN